MDVSIALEDRAQGIGDLSRCERACGDLISERLEQVEVPAIDERDLDLRVPEPESRLKACEATAHHDDAVWNAGDSRAAYRGISVHCLVPR